MRLVTKSVKYFKERLVYVAAIWAAVGAIAWLLPRIVSELETDKPSYKLIFKLKLEQFADWRVVLIISLAAMALGGLKFLITSLVTMNGKDKQQSEAISQKIADEISSAATHFACANTLIVLMTTVDGMQLLWGFCYILLGFFTFKD